LTAEVSKVESGLQSLLLCGDDKVVRVLRRVLSEMEIAIEQVSDADSATQKLTRQRFEAVIVDCTDPEIARKVLSGTRAAPANRRAITVAILDAEASGDSQAALKRAFAMGSHFVLFKPISLERTRASFRAVRALMKRERRRHARIPIELPVLFQLPDQESSFQANTLDLGENGIAVNTRGRRLPQSFQLSFTPPGMAVAVDCRGEVAWEGGQLLGIRFADLTVETKGALNQWVGRQLQGPETEEAPVSCKLTDLSPSACYLQTESPFPVRTRLLMKMKVGELVVETEGMVRLMHPAAGMGVEFTKNTSVQKARVEDFIRTLVSTTGAVPDIEVKPDTIDNSADAYSFWQLPDDRIDPLLSLFRSKTDLPPEVFQMELRKQRGVPEEVAIAAY
jgi:DNA-binding response OmpR family regulator